MTSRPRYRFLYLRYLLLLSLSLFSLFPTAVLSDTAPRRKIIVIPISGEVDPGMAAFVKRVFEKVSNTPDNLYIIEMDTFGGRVDAALDIVDTLSNKPKGETLAFVTKRAISAGALIALSANRLTMRHNTTIGDCAPISMTNEGVKMMGEKFQSPLRAKFRALAKKNNYPVLLAESMVSMEKEVYQITRNGETSYMDNKEYSDLTESEKSSIRSKKTIVNRGELLTMDDKEAEEYGFSRTSASSINDMLDKLGYKEYEIIRIQETWSETFARYIGGISSILLLIGFAAIYLEFKAPGFGIPGIVGILCLFLVFFGQHFVGLAAYSEGLLVLIGIALLGMEVFVIPGFGVAGITGMACIVIGTMLMFQGFILPDPALPWQKEILFMNASRIVGILLISFFLVFLFFRFGLSRLSKVVSGPYLDTTLEQSHADSKESLGANPGDLGIAQSFLRPSGKIKIGGKKFDAITQGEFIEKGTEIEIFKIDGNRIIVRDKNQEET